MRRRAPESPLRETREWAATMIDKMNPPIVSLILFLATWEAAIRIFSISALILPSPFEVIKMLFIEFGYLLSHTSITLLEAILGLLMGGLVAGFLAILFQFSNLAERTLYPYAIGLKAIPLVALAPLVVVWFGTGMLSKVILAAIISFFPILVNFSHGLRSVDDEALDLMKTLSATPKQTFIKLRIPHSLPDLFSGLKISSTFAVVGAVVAEFVGSQAGIGFVIKSSSYYLETAMMFSAIIMAAVGGIIFYITIEQLEKYVIFWENGCSEHP